MSLLGSIDKPAPALEPRREPSKKSKSEGMSAYDRACAYVERMPGGVQGKGGSLPCMRAAVACARGFGLSVDDTVRVLQKAHNPNCTPEWPEHQLKHKAASAAKSERVPFGYLLDRHDEYDGDHGVSDNDKTAIEDSDPFEGRWLQLSEHREILVKVPPETDWLLKRWHEGRDVGVFPRGKTGLVTATGGVGKTYNIIDLALAVAIGGFWLGTFRCVKPGHVLLALGEEERDEAWRRIWRTANAKELTPEQRRMAAENIDVLPLYGMPVAFTRALATGVVCETDVADTFRRRLEARGVDWALLLFDPLSRFAGGGVEKDNEVATRFCQTIERFASARGNPSVIVAHHSSQATARAGESDARGVTGIRDGFRWMASMDELVDENGAPTGVRFRSRKSNYSLPFPELALVRNTEPGIEGTLRLASSTEASSMAPKGGRAVTEHDIQERVLETVRKHPGLTSANEVAEMTQGTKGKVLAAVKALRLKGHLVVEGGSLVVREPEGEHR